MKNITCVIISWKLAVGKHWKVKEVKFLRPVNMHFKRVDFQNRFNHARGRCLDHLSTGVYIK